MFSRFRDFLYRHRRKFYIGGAIIGGAALLSRYAEKKLLEWHDRQTRMLIERQKKRQHYDNTVRTSCATVLSLSGSMKEVIGRELDADTLLQALRDQPQHKRNIWEQLKVVGFSRAACAVYVGSLVCAAIRVQLMLLGGYTFGELITTGQDPRTPITQSLQQKYLAAVHYLVEQGTPRLVSQVTKAVTHITAGLPLNRSLTLPQLEAIFHEIRLTLAGEGIEPENTSGRPEKKLTAEQWSSYVLCVPHPPEGDSEEDRILYNMLVETSDVLDSEDFNSTMDTLIQHGINTLLDRLADFYPSPKFNGVTTSSENWVDNISRDTETTKTLSSISDVSSPTTTADSLTNDISAPTTSQYSVIHNNTAAATTPSITTTTASPTTTPPPATQYSTTNTSSLDASPLSNAATSINTSSLPVAKLVPVVSGIVHGALSPAQGHLLHKLLSNDKLDTLGANVYEAFAVPRAE
ncbi:hypothetical protein Pmani_016502 [Petrolisthes manimaculis]|uniref:Peroxisomal biogenesis factor 3 n=1 Tax=Petrolisthes manimaculis TaxID=1843537 RepID=A0AAE1U8P5_9EUCA|nr:hypothetical protein Pmani_016502 [Petrolisthes manimaculis]